MKIIEEKERPEKATLIVDAYKVDEVVFPSGDKAKKLFLHGKIPEVDAETDISATDTGALWVKDEATAENIVVGSKSNTSIFLKVFKIKKEKDLVGKKYPLIQKPSKADPNRKFYVINTSA